MQIMLRYDLRSAPFGAPHADLYRAALEQADWLDGLDVAGVGVVISEHHGSPDGYLPSPFVFAAAVAGRTRRAFVSIAAALAPFHHPIRLAEDIAVLDLVSGGRVSVVLAAGYRYEEFAMFGLDTAQRGALVEETVATLKRAWSGEAFDFRGETVMVTPRPFQRPRPPIVLGGSSPAAARRAARIADGFLPSSPDLMDVYRAERERLGFDAGPATAPTRYGSVALVTDDPDEGWAAIGEYCLHEMNTYAAWFASGAGGSGPYFHVPDVDALRATGKFLVVTPDECIELARDAGTLTLCPLIGGFPPDLARAGLELIERKVVPALGSGPTGLG